MTQKLYNLDMWAKIGPGQMMPFTVKRPRSVSVEVNAPQRSEMWLWDEETGEGHFLAVVDGRDRLEFEVTGPFHLGTNDVDVFVYSEDSTSTHIVVEAPETFTKVMQRRHRNPELEAIARAMKFNFERQMAKQAEHYDQLIQRSVAALIPQSPAPSVPASPAAEPKPAAKGGGTDEPPAAAGS